MQSNTEPLRGSDLERVEAQRDWVRNHFAPEARAQYDTLEGKLRLLDTILKAGWIRSDETVKLQCLGITLGDALAQQLGLIWVAIEDEYGRDPALHDATTGITLFPLTMISKRVEKGESVDVYALFTGVCERYSGADSGGPH